MAERKQFDVLIIGGSYSGLAAGMALGRALKHVLIIDSGKPCNRQTPFSHNFLTQDGKTPKEISMLAKQQVELYDTVKFYNGVAIKGSKTKNGFHILTDSGETFHSKKIIFATGIKDIMPDIKGYAECWGITVLHCPYCHGYEVRNEATGILSNGDHGFEFSTLISNWTKDLTLYTNGVSSLAPEQKSKLESHSIKIDDREVKELVHTNGQLKSIIFKDGSAASVKALYAHSAFEQHSTIPENLGCELNEQGYIKVDALQKTTVDGVFACGDNTTRMRWVANSVAMGATAGAMVNREIIFEEF